MRELSLRNALLNQNMLHVQTLDIMLKFFFLIFICPVELVCNAYKTSQMAGEEDKKMKPEARITTQKRIAARTI